MVDTVKWKSEHHHALDELEATIPQGLIAQWRGEVETWEEDSTKPNSFQSCVVREYTNSLPLITTLISNSNHTDSHAFTAS